MTAQQIEDKLIKKEKEEKAEQERQLMEFHQREHKREKLPG